MNGTCDVPGCTNKTYMGWRPLSEPKGKQICEYHWNLHKVGGFDLFEAFGFRRPAGRPGRRIQDGSPRCACSRALPSVKPVVKAEPKPEPVRGNPSGCKACGAERQAGHIFCPTCSQQRKAESNRQRRMRAYRKARECSAFVPELTGPVP